MKVQESERTSLKGVVNQTFGELEFRFTRARNGDSMVRMRWAAILAVGLFLPAHADIISLKSGGKLQGWIKADDKDEVVIEVAAGVVCVPKEDIASIDLDHEDKLEVFYQMWSTFKNAKVAEGYCFLVRWCQENKLEKFVPMLKRACWEIDPRHDFEHKVVAKQEDKPKVGSTAVQEDPKPKPSPTEPGKTTSKPGYEPKSPKKTAPLKVTVATTWVPPLAKIGPSGSITYPPNALPGPTGLGLDGLSVPYWGIPPAGVETMNAAEDFVRLKGEFSNDGLMNAVRTWRIVERERDILLIPPNAGNTRQWRLIYSLAPKQVALPAIQGIRSGNLKTK